MLADVIYRLKLNRERALQSQHKRLEVIQGDLISNLFQFLSKQDNKLDHLDKELSLLDPQNIMDRGYSITMIDGQNINKVKKINFGAKIKTIASNVEVDSLYQSSKKRK